MHTYTALVDLASCNTSTNSTQVFESEHFYHRMISELAAAVYTCDDKGYIKTYNKAAVELWGREPEIGKDLWCGSWKTFCSDGTPITIEDCPMAKTLKQKCSVRNEEIIVERPDGVRRHVLPHPDPIFDTAGKLIGAVNLLVDITEIRQKEQTLRELTREIETRVKQRTKDLKEANTLLLQKNADLEQFAFIASHDMQEPMRKIKTFTNLLEIKGKAHLDLESNVLIHKIQSSANRMSGLITDILKFSRLGYQKEEFVETDLNKILDDEIEALDLTIEQKQARIIRGKLPPIKAIPELIGHLFRNILSNSLKFSREKIPPRIHIRSGILTPAEVAEQMLEQHYSYCEIVFQDNGIGFDQEYAQRIFKIFSRLNTQEKYEGSGIGLALCSKMVKIHNGKMFAKSSMELGTAIHVILPVDFE